MTEISTAQRFGAHPRAACPLRRRDATRRADGAAEAAGQATAAHRVLRRVSRRGMESRNYLRSMHVCFTIVAIDWHFQVTHG
jgi:hypothetical protein